MRRHKEMQELTPAETEVMDILWRAGKALTVREVLMQYPEPRPAYTTVATFLKILVSKGAVAVERREDGNRSNYFSPTLSKAQYTQRVMNHVKNLFFGGSVKSIVDYFIEEEDISREELLEYLEELCKCEK